MLKFITCFCACTIWAMPTLAQDSSSVENTGQNYRQIGINGSFSSVRGNSACRADLDLAFAVSGILTEVKIEEGDEIAAGDLIVLLDQQMETLEVDRRKVLWEDKADFNSALAKQKVAKKQWKTAQALLNARGSISKEEVQNRKLAQDLALVEVERFTAQEKLEEIDYKIARVAQAGRSMRAPSKGIVSDILKKPGESVQAYEPVVALCDISQIIFVASLPSFGSNTVQDNEAVELHFPGHDEVVKGWVSFISPVVDAASGLREIKIEMPTQPDWMRPGLGADLILKP